MTQTVQTGFNDAFRKESDADCATAAGPEQEAGQGRHPSTLVDTVGRGRGGTVPSCFLAGEQRTPRACRSGLLDAQEGGMSTMATRTPNGGPDARSRPQGPGRGLRLVRPLLLH